MPQGRRSGSTMVPISKEKMKLGDQVDVEFISAGVFRGTVVKVRRAAFDVHFPCDGST